MKMSKLIFLKKLYYVYVMFLSFYTFIVILIVQVIKNVDAIESEDFLIRNFVKREAINKGTTVLIKNKGEETFSSTVGPRSVNDDNNKASFVQLKGALEMILNKLNSLDVKPQTESPKQTTTVLVEKPETTSAATTTQRTTTATTKRATTLTHAASSTHSNTLFPQAAVSTVSSSLDKRQKSEDTKKTKWAPWTEWSCCSVTCGKGRKIRWRHCLQCCDEAETEMEEKTCQLPACPPHFGI